VVVWRGDLLHFHHVAPCFNLQQLELLGREIHTLFSGYRSMDRHTSGLSLRFDGRYLQILQLKLQDAPVYVAALAENLESLGLAIDTIAGWTVESLFEEQKKSEYHHQPKASTQHLWSHFLLRLKSRLEESLGPEAGSELLNKALVEFDAGPTRPLPEDQWLTFSHHIADQITDPQALMAFNQLHWKTDNS
jgi:hypothetical protein